MIAVRAGIVQPNREQARVPCQSFKCWWGKVFFSFPKHPD